MTLQSAAVALARKGMAVFPCKPRSKEPATRYGVKDATADVEVVNAWWNGWPDSISAWPLARSPASGCST